MAVNIKMPALSPTMTEGRLSKWLVKAGDSVRSGDVIAEIETDKATMEVEAVEEGIVGEITVAEGSEGVAVGAVIARLLEEGETALPEEKDAVAQSSTLAPSAEAFSADLAVAEPVTIPGSALPLPPEPDWDGKTKTQTVREALRDAMAEECVATIVSSSWVRKLLNIRAPIRLRKACWKNFRTSVSLIHQLQNTDLQDWA